jgi:hypothetical protein
MTAERLLWQTAIQSAFERDLRLTIVTEEEYQETVLMYKAGVTNVRDISSLIFL